MRIFCVAFHFNTFVKNTWSRDSQFHLTSLFYFYRVTPTLGSERNLVRRVVRNKNCGFDL